MKMHASKAAPPVIPTASMADIAFLLIIFFMLTFTLEVDRTQVTLPRTELRFEVPKKAAYISVTEQGVIRASDGERQSTVIPEQDVLSFAAEVVAIQPDKEFALKADGAVPYKYIDTILDSLKQANVRVIYLLSQAETVDDQ